MIWKQNRLGPSEPPWSKHKHRTPSVNYPELNRKKLIDNTENKDDLMKFKLAGVDKPQTPLRRQKKFLTTSDENQPKLNATIGDPRFETIKEVPQESPILIRKKLHTHVGIRKPTKKSELVSINSNRTLQKNESKIDFEPNRTLPDAYPLLYPSVSPKANQLLYKGVIKKLFGGDGVIKTEASAEDNSDFIEEKPYGLSILKLKKKVSRKDLLKALTSENGRIKVPSRNRHKESLKSRIERTYLRTPSSNIRTPLSLTTNNFRIRTDTSFNKKLRASSSSFHLHTEPSLRLKPSTATTSNADLYQTAGSDKIFGNQSHLFQIKHTSDTGPSNHYSNGHSKTLEDMSPLKIAKPTPSKLSSTSSKLKIRISGSINNSKSLAKSSYGLRLTTDPGESSKETLEDYFGKTNPSVSPKKGKGSKGVTSPSANKEFNMYGTKIGRVVPEIKRK